MCHVDILSWIVIPPIIVFQGGILVGLQDLSSLTRDLTHVLCSENPES